MLGQARVMDYKNPHPSTKTLQTTSESSGQRWLSAKE